MAKKLKSIKTGFLERGLSLAKLTLQTGSQAAAYGLNNFLQGQDEGRRQKMLVGQMALLAKHFGELKGSLMKVGQMLSVYGEHFLPPEANRLLKTLHFESPPLDWPSIEKHLRKQLTKEKLQELEIDPEPLAAASLGQVHRAKVRQSGQEIVLKIQYPGVEEAIDGDIQALKRLLGMAKLLPKLPNTDSIFAEIKTMLLHELDYKAEATSLAEFRTNLQNDPRYLVPQVLTEYCSKRVIAMSYEVGHRLDGQEVAALSQARRNQIGEAFLDLYFRELFHWRAVQTDPHFGNYRVQITNNQERLVLYDFGAIRKFSRTFLEKYKALLAGCFFQDKAAFETAAASLDLLEEGDSEKLKQDFWELCSLLMDGFLKLDRKTYDWSTSQLPQRVVKHTSQMAVEHKLRAPPPELVFLDRKMVGVFTCLAVLRADFNGRNILQNYLKNPE